MLVVLARYPDPLKAHIARGLLQTEGIAAYVDDAAGLSLGRRGRPVIGGARLCVPRPQAARARSVLLAFEQGDYTLEDDESTHADAADARPTAPRRASWLARLRRAALRLLHIRPHG